MVLDADPRKPVRDVLSPVRSRILVLVAERRDRGPWIGILQGGQGDSTGQAPDGPLALVVSGRIGLYGLRCIPVGLEDVLARSRPGKPTDPHLCSEVQCWDPVECDGLS